jgi:hypothetical protein
VRSAVCGQTPTGHCVTDGLLVGMYQGCAEARPWNVWSAFVMLAVWQQDGANDRGGKWRRGNRAVPHCTLKGWPAARARVRAHAAHRPALARFVRCFLALPPRILAVLLCPPSALILPPPSLTPLHQSASRCEVLQKLLSHSKVPPPKSLRTCSLRLATRAHTIGLDSGPKRVQLHAFIRLPSCSRNIYTLSARHPSRFTFVDLLMETTS